MNTARRVIFVCIVALAAPAAFGGGYVCRAVDIPGSTWTSVGQINNAGQLVATSDLGSAIDSAGTWTFLPAPPAGSGYGPADLAATGINDAGVVVGTAFNSATGTIDGFQLDGGTYAFFTNPTAADTVPRSISSSDVILGDSEDPTAGTSVGWRRDPGGMFTTFLPIERNGIAAFSVIPGAMNDAGDFVGSAYFPRDGVYSFIFDPGTAQFSLFRISGLPTHARGINNHGKIVASTMDSAAGLITPWVFDNGIAQPIQCPGINSADGLFAESINDAEVVSGNWTDAAGNSHGFLVSPDLTSEFDALLGASTGVGPGKSLASKARTAKQAYAAGDLAGACSALHDFTSEVAAQSGKSLSPSQAAALASQARTIMQALGCSTA